MMDKRLISSQYIPIAKNVRALSDDIAYLKRQCDLIGTSCDTHEFRKPLTAKIQAVQHLVMKIKTKLKNAQDSGMFEQQKWRKLNEQFVSQFERLSSASDDIRAKLKRNAMRGSIGGQSDNEQLLRKTSSGYGSTQSQAQAQTQEQEVLFTEYVGGNEELYELENFEEQIFTILDSLQDLNQAQRDLNDLVHEMDEPIQMLVDNTYDALENVEAGVQNIEKAGEHLKAYRGKMCCVLGALLIIAIIVSVIIVVSTKKRDK